MTDYKKLQNIINKSKKLEDIKSVCYQGMPSSYSHIVSKSLFKDKIYINKPTFEDVFYTVNSNKADIGVIPIENSTAGYINDIYDLLLKYDLYINYNYIKKVDHCLAGTGDSSFEDIKEVYSHPQAILQCKEYLKANGLKAIYESNTAVAAQKISETQNKQYACICSSEAAKEYGLKILDRQINDNKLNFTRFAAVSKELKIDENHNKISIVLNAAHKAGSLADILSKFSYLKINLSSIYSRPNLNNPWEYMFYIDFDGNLSDDNVQETLFQLFEELPFVKILGSYTVD